MNVARPASLLFSGFAEGASIERESGEQIVVLRFADGAAAARAVREAPQLCADAGGTAAETGDGEASECVVSGHRISADSSENLVFLHLTKEEP